MSLGGKDLTISYPGVGHFPNLSGGDKICMLRNDQGNVSPLLSDTMSVVLNSDSDSCAMFPQKRKVGAAADQPTHFT